VHENRAQRSHTSVDLHVGDGLTGLAGRADRLEVAAFDHSMAGRILTSEIVAVATSRAPFAMARILPMRGAKLRISQSRVERLVKKRW
jgi:hypothetical protein